VIETIKFFFSVRTETNQNSICLGCFSVCFAKPKNIFSVGYGLFRCFGPVLKQPNKQNFVETNRKNLKKTFSIRGSSKPLIFFLSSNRNKPKINLFPLFFGLLFRETKIFFPVCFDVSDRYQNNQNKQNLWYGELKRLIF
jgi:hypothetical protein